MNSPVRAAQPWLPGLVAICAALLPPCAAAQQPKATPRTIAAPAAPPRSGESSRPVESLRYARMAFDRELYNEALRVYGVWAERGNMEAQQRFGLMHEYGLGTVRDGVTAERWYRLAAQQAAKVGDDPASINALAWLHDYGRGGLARDPQKALALYRRAAEAGFAPAQANLGTSYAEGSAGLPKDMQQAVFWLKKAADQDYQRAQRQLDTLRTNGYDTGDPANSPAAVGRGSTTPFAELEALRRRDLAATAKRAAPDSFEVAQAQQALAAVLVGKDAEAESLLRKASATYQRVLGADHPDALTVTHNLGVVLGFRGRFAESQAILRRVLAQRERRLPPGDPDIVESQQSLGNALSAMREWDEAETLLRHALHTLDQSLAATTGNGAAAAPRRPVTRDELTSALNNLANCLAAQGRYQEAEPLLLRAVALQEGAAAPGGPQLNLDLPIKLNNLAQLRVRMGDYAGALPLLTRALSLAERALGATANTALVATSLGDALTKMQRPGEALAPLARAQSIYEKQESPRSRSLVPVFAGLGDAQQAVGRPAEAAASYRRALEIAATQLPPDDETTMTIVESLGRLQLHQGELPAAVAQLRRACAVRDAARSAASRGRAAATQGKARGEASSCSVAQAAALYGWAAGGGARADSDQPAALQREAFVAAQRASQSAASDALARSAAMIADRAAGAGKLAADYERALDQRDAYREALSRSYGAAPVQDAAQDADQRQFLVKSISDTEQDLRRLEGELRARASRYWDLRSPAAVSLEELQHSPGVPLLRANEALVLWMMAPGADKGLVFAVSRNDFAVAEMTLDGTQVDERVRRLRAQIDPCGQAQDSADCARAATGVQQFDRRSAWELHQALLGSPAVQRVIGAAGLDTLLVVPTGSLTALPPAVLIAREPVRDGDDNREGALRDEDWLIRHKAIAVLPSVAALRTLRQLLPASTSTAPAAAEMGTAPLFMLANPAFAPGVTARCGGDARRSIPAAAQDYFRDARLRSDALAKLPPLPCTALEAEGLRQLLNAPAQDVITGAAAREVVLRQRRADVRSARVLAFATHGLVSGDLGLAEPGLALAPPLRSNAQEATDDGLLTASKIAQLELTADWVVLSACNTASPDAPSAPGLSGLSRAFFHAGARALLVSHWRVEDHATQALILGTFRQRAQGGISKAEALRRASLAVMAGEDIVAPADEIADLRNHRAHPAAWAPFVLIGTPD